MVPAPAQPVGLCAFLGGRRSRFWVGSEVVSSLRKLLYWPEAQVYSDGRSAEGWPELCHAPLPSHVPWPVACSQDSAAPTTPLRSHISSPLHYDWNPLLCPQPPYTLVTDPDPCHTHTFTKQYWGLLCLCWTLAIIHTPVRHPGGWMEGSKNQRLSGKDLVSCVGSPWHP